MMLLVENVRSGKQEEVTEVQWETMQKVFPRMFRIVPPNLENYSDEAKKIIAGKSEEE